MYYILAWWIIGALSVIAEAKIKGDDVLVEDILISFIVGLGGLFILLYVIGTTVSFEWFWKLMEKKVF